MNKYLTIGILVFIVVLLVIYRNKLTLYFSGNAAAAQAPAGAPIITAATPAAVTINRDRILKRGITGEEVRLLQLLLGVTADGIFGPVTEAALEEQKCDIQTTLNSFPDQTCEIADVDDAGGGDWSSGTVISTFLNVFN